MWGLIICFACFGLIMLLNDLVADKAEKREAKKEKENA